MMVKKMKEKGDFDRLEGKISARLFLEQKLLKEKDFNAKEQKVIRKMLKHPFDILKKKNEKLMLTKNGKSIARGYLKGLMVSHELFGFGKKKISEKEIVLVPIAKDPLVELRRIGKKAGIDRYTIKELRRMALEEAEKEIFGKNNNSIKKMFKIAKKIKPRHNLTAKEMDELIENEILNRNRIKKGLKGTV